MTALSVSNTAHLLPQKARPEGGIAAAVGQLVFVAAGHSLQQHRAQQRLLLKQCLKLGHSRRRHGRRRGLLRLQAAVVALQLLYWFYECGERGRGQVSCQKTDLHRVLAQVVGGVEQQHVELHSLHQRSGQRLLRVWKCRVYLCRGSIPSNSGPTSNSRWYSRLHSHARWWSERMPVALHAL